MGWNIRGMTGVWAVVSRLCILRRLNADTEPTWLVFVAANDIIQASGGSGEVRPTLKL